MKGTRDSGRSHAANEQIGRLRKARKIELLMGLTNLAVPLRILEIGTGSGFIAYYFATLSSTKHHVTATDVVDGRQESRGYEFVCVEGTTLPFPDGSFDLIISNHVLEHVGRRSEQLALLQEMNRVLAQNGRGYLAMPSRWMLREPHYHLYGLSWLPRAWRSRYLWWRRGVRTYDCEPLSQRQLEALLSEASMDYKNLGTSAIRAIATDPEDSSRLARAAARLPEPLLNLLLPILPTLVYEFWTRAKVVAP